MKKTNGAAGAAASDGAAANDLDPGLVVPGCWLPLPASGLADEISERDLAAESGDASEHARLLWLLAFEQRSEIGTPTDA